MGLLCAVKVCGLFHENSPKQNVQSVFFFSGNIAAFILRFHCISEILPTDSSLNSSLYLFIRFAKAKPANLVRLFICEGILHIQTCCSLTPP